MKKSEIKRKEKKNRKGKYIKKNEKKPKTFLKKYGKKSMGKRL